MFGFGFHLGFPDGRPRGDGGGAPVPRVLTGTVDVDPTFSANLSTGIELEGTVQVNPLLWGGLDPLRILTGDIQVDPEFTANLQVTRALRGTIQVDPVFDADLEEVLGHMLAGTINVDPVFEGELQEPPLLDPPEFIATNSSSGSTGGGFNWAYPAGTQAGDLVLIAIETARQSPFTFTDADWTLLYTANIGTVGGATSTQLAIYGKFVGVDSSAAGTFTTVDHFYRVSMTFRNVLDTGNPTMATRLGSALASIMNAQNAGANPTFSGMTTTANKSMVVCIAAHATDSASATAGFSSTGGLTDPTTRNNAGTATGNGGGIGVLTGTKAVAGAISPDPVFTLPGSVNYCIRGLEIYGATS